MRHYLWHPMNWGKKPSDPAWINARLHLWDTVVYPQIQKSSRKWDEIIVTLRSSDTYAVAQWRQRPVRVVLYDKFLLADDEMLNKDRLQEWVTVTRQDCDDLLATTYLEYVQAIQPERGLAAVCRSPGLCLNTRSGEFGEWRRQFPPTSTIFIPGDIWQDRVDAHKYAYCEHPQVRVRFKHHTFLPTLSYCVLIHGMNTTSKLENPVPRGDLPVSKVRSLFPILERYL